MNENQRGLALVVIILIIIVLLAGGILAWQYLGVSEKEAEVPKEEMLKEEIIEDLSPTTAFLLLSDVLALHGFKDCLPGGDVPNYSSCIIDIDISEEKYEGIITVTYDGLYDDSIKAERFRATVMYQNGQWVRGDVSWEQQCWPRRGHQDFSTEFCL